MVPNLFRLNKLISGCSILVDAAVDSFRESFVSTIRTLSYSRPTELELGEINQGLSGFGYCVIYTEKHNQT